MKIKPIRYLPIFLAGLFALSVVNSIHAQDNSAIPSINLNNHLPGQRGLVVQASNTPISPDPTAVPVIVSTPLPDGTVIHIIAAGQSLWAVCEGYNITLETLLELNGLEPDAVINPGDELIISPAHTPTSTPIGEPSSTPPPRYSHTPSLGTPQGTSLSFSPATSQPTETLIVEPRFRTSAKRPLVVIAAVVVSGGSLAAALYFSLRGRE